MGTDGVRERYINPCADFGFEKLSGMGMDKGLFSVWQLPVMPVSKSSKISCAWAKELQSINCILAGLKWGMPLKNPG